VVSAPPVVKMSPYKPVVIVLPPYSPPKAKKIVAAPKPKHTTPAVAAGADHVYPRAKPVDSADLAVAPSVKSTPPVKAHAVATDPNSLGAPLNPVGAYPPMNPRKPVLDLRDDSTPTGVVPSSMIPRPGGETVP
jgi:hypothetical protein